MSAITVIYADRPSPVDASSESDSLWIEAADLARVSGWKLKPEGACKGDICIPIPPAREAEFVRADGPASTSRRSRVCSDNRCFTTTTMAYGFLAKLPIRAAPRSPRSKRLTSNSPISTARCIGCRTIAAAKSCSPHGRPGEGAVTTCQSGRASTKN